MGDFDAIAVGGGLAGAAFALELARAGARVAVIERTGSPSLKVCGDFLSGEAQQLLAHLGLDGGALGAAPITTFRLISGERCATAQLPFAGCGLSRLYLDEALLAKAQAAGAVLIRGESATALEPAGDVVRVRVRDKTCAARSVALATGKHNLRGIPRGPGTKTAMKVQLSLTRAAAADLDGVVQLVSFRGGYVGACNVEGDAATICWLLDVRALSELGPDWRVHLDHIARESPAFGDLLAGARFLSEKPAAVSAIPYGFKRRAVIAENVFPVGDQLGVIPSFTGDGTSLALASGIAAARAVLAGCGAGRFQAEHLKRIRTQFLCARGVEAMFWSAPARALGVNAIALAPRLVGLIARLTRVRDVGRLIAAPV